LASKPQLDRAEPLQLRRLSTRISDPLLIRKTSVVPVYADSWLDPVVSLFCLDTSFTLPVAAMPQLLDAGLAVIMSVIGYGSTPAATLPSCGVSDPNLPLFAC
jgi:hypothetical protein